MSIKGTVQLASLALVIGLLVSGCGLAHARSGQGTLQVWTTWAGDPAPLQALFDRYGQEGGRPVRLTMGVKSARLAKALAGSTPPDVVILTNGDPLLAYHEQGLVEPLDAWIETTGIDLEDFDPASLASDDGAILGLPWVCDVYALFWNVDLFRAAGLDPERPPQTMEELVEYAAGLTLRDEAGELTQLGFLPDLGRPHDDLYARLLDGGAGEWQRQFYELHGAEEVEDWVSSLTPYTDSSHPLYAGRRLDCRQCHRSAPPKAKKTPDRIFATGKVAMRIGGQWLVAPNRSSGVQAGLEFGVAPFPPPADRPERAQTAAVESAMVLLPVGARDKEAAARLLAWMMSPEIAAEAADATASLPASRQAAQDPRFRQDPALRVFADLLGHPSAGPSPDSSGMDRHDPPGVDRHDPPQGG
jgi:multiple sugar transport system substrate-binding protein